MRGDFGSKLIWFGALAVIAVLVVVLEIWSHTVIVVHP